MTLDRRVIDPQGINLCSALLIRHDEIFTRVMVAAIAHLSLATGIALVATVLARGLSPLLAMMAALFGIGWLAHVAFLAQQLPLLVPKVGAAAATTAVAASTAA